MPLRNDPALKQGLDCMQEPLDLPAGIAGLSWMLGGQEHECAFG